MVTMFTIDSDAAMARALSNVGRSFTPQGYCLQHTAEWQLNGRTSVFGQQGRVAQIALDAWNWETADNKRAWYPGMILTPDYNGLTFHFGVSPTRTDKNKAAGDITTIYNGKLICTDASGARVGIMSVSERASEVGRPPLGVSLQTLGTPTTAGLRIKAGGTSAPIIPTGNQDMDYLIQSRLRTNVVAIFNFSGVFQEVPNAYQTDLETMLGTKLKPVDDNWYQFYAARAGQFRDDLAKRVWDELIDGFNGPQPARTREAGIDERKENVATIDPAVTKGLVADIIAALPAGNGGTPPTAAEVATATVDLLAKRAVS